MVETITPVVHGGRRSRWGVFLLLHAAGAGAAAAAFGAALGGAGALLGAPWGAAGLALVAAACLAYLARELFGLPVPVPQLRRQVPDWWRTFFPFGPASFLYGVGLGVGFLTYLSHGTLVVVSAAAFASGRPLEGAAFVGSFGIARGLSAAVAMGARTPQDGAELVGRLARSSRWGGWRAAHVLALVAVLAAAARAARVGTASASEVGSAAAATLAVAFGSAAVAKLVGARSWRRALAAYGLPRPVGRAAAGGVPVVELALGLLPFLGLASTVGLAALGVLAVFSIAILVARMRVGRTLECGCFGAASWRDYRVLLARNAALALLAVVAWRAASDAPVGLRLSVPWRDDLAPVVLVLVGLGLAVWLVVQTAIVARRGAGR